MATPVTVTPFQLGDLRALLQLEGEVFSSDAYGMAEFLALFMRGRDTFLVARAGTAVAGYIAAYAEGETGYIASLAVDPVYQRQGIGRLLVKTVMERLAGVRSVGLHVRQDNTAAIQLYESLGFVTRDTVPAYYEDGMAALYMEATNA